MKKIPLIALLFVIPFFVLAQNRTIKGTVSDEKGVPVGSASVLLKGSSTTGCCYRFVSFIGQCCYKMGAY